MTPISRSPRDVQERRKRFEKIFEDIRRISATRPKIPRRRLPPTHEVEPIKLGQRVVFRSQGQIPVKPLIKLHKLIRSDSIRATEALSVGTEGEPTKLRNSGLHCAIRHHFEERLKTTAQLTGIFPPDPELTRPTQELFEQFFEAHGLPNDAESELLQAVGYVDAETVDAWFTLKVFRLRGSLSFKKKMKEAMLQAYDANMLPHDLATSEPNIWKPYSRH